MKPLTVRMTERDFAHAILNEIHDRIDEHRARTPARLKALVIDPPDVRVVVMSEPTHMYPIDPGGTRGMVGSILGIPNVVYDAREIPATERAMLPDGSMVSRTPPYVDVTGVGARIREQRLSMWQEAFPNAWRDKAVEAGEEWVL